MLLFILMVDEKIGDSAAILLVLHARNLLGHILSTQIAFNYLGDTFQL